MSDAGAPPSRSADYRIETVTTLARLDELETEWNALADTAGNPLARHEWMAECVRAFAPEAELSVRIARDAHGARAIAPLLIERSGAAARLRLLSWETYEPEAFLHDDETALAAVCAHVARSGRPLLLWRLGAGSSELAALQAAHRGRGVTVVRPGSTQSWANPTPGGWATFEAAMSSKQRGALRRNWKKLEETGPVRFEALAPDDAQFGELFETFLQVEATAWKRQKGTSLLQDDRARRFYTAYGRKAARLGMLRLFLLHVGDRVAAGQLHVLHADRLWALKIGYDEAFAQRSPGAVLTHEVLRYACQHGVKSFEHLGLAETWQTRWPTEPREHSTLRLYPASSRGAVGLLLDTADVSWAKLKARAQARLQPGTRRATGTAGAG